MKTILKEYASKLLGTASTKLAQLDESKTVGVIKQGVDIIDDSVARFTAVIFWLKVVAFSFISIVVLLLLNLGFMIFL